MAQTTKGAAPVGAPRRGRDPDLPRSESGSPAPAPARFAFVMGTGVISLALELDRAQTVSLAFLAIAALGYLELLWSEAYRIARSPNPLGSISSSPRSLLGLFTFGIATEVLASRIAVLGLGGVAVALFCGGGLEIMACCYFVPWLVALRRPVADPLAEAGGFWLLWPVSLEALGVGASVMSRYAHFQPQVLAVLAVALWAVGLAVYLPLLGVVLGRLVIRGAGVRQLGPSYWITMGAAALSALGAAQISSDPATRVHLLAFAGLASSAGIALWFLASALLPVVVGMTVARTALRQRLQGTPKELWAAVFPSGMYALASLALGPVTGDRWLLAVGAVAIWGAVAVFGADLGRGVLLRLLPSS